jgi:molybdopterin synthase catalytic subunit
MTPVARLTRRPIDSAALLASVAGPRHGAVLLFLGVVREVNGGRAVTGIEYRAYEAMAARELAAIAAEVIERFDATDVAIEHRLGELALEEASVGIAVAHAHRGVAYDASRWVIEELKRRVPIWKREEYADGTREWVDPSGRPAAALLEGQR